MTPQAPASARITRAAFHAYQTRRGTYEAALLAAALGVPLAQAQLWARQSAPNQ